jgi:hypothetical protein
MHWIYRITEEIGRNNGLQRFCFACKNVALFIILLKANNFFFNLSNPTNSTLGETVWVCGVYADVTVSLQINYKMKTEKVL